MKKNSLPRKAARDLSCIKWWENEKFFYFFSPQNTVVKIKGLYALSHLVHGEKERKYISSNDWLPGSFYLQKRAVIAADCHFSKEVEDYIRGTGLKQEESAGAVFKVGEGRADFFGRCRRK